MNTQSPEELWGMEIVTFQSQDEPCYLLKRWVDVRLKPRLVLLSWLKIYSQASLKPFTRVSMFLVYLHTKEVTRWNYFL